MHGRYCVHGFKTGNKRQIGLKRHDPSGSARGFWGFGEFKVMILGMVVMGFLIIKSLNFYGNWIWKFCEKYWVVNFGLLSLNLLFFMIIFRVVEMEFYEDVMGVILIKI